MVDISECRADGKLAESVYGRASVKKGGRKHGEMLMKNAY